MKRIATKEHKEHKEVFKSKKSFNRLNSKEV